LFLWILLLKPWIRDKRMSWDGMLMLCLLSMWVLDPICNYFNFSFMYNAYWINRGSWCLYLPGWQSPRGSNLPEPFFLMGGIYLWWTTINVLVFSWTLRKLRVWLPKYSMLVHIPIGYAVICALDMILELPACFTGLFAYPGAPVWATLWAGTPHQFPLYETFFMNFNYTSIGLLRFYRDDKGESWAEKGVSRMQLSAKAKTTVRFFALLGFCNLSYFIVYFMPYNWMAMQADTFPKYPSYMRYEICGHGTPYACPSREVPVQSRTSLAIPPDDPHFARGEIDEPLQPSACRAFRCGAGRRRRLLVAVARLAGDSRLDARRGPTGPLGQGRTRARTRRREIAVHAQLYFRRIEVAARHRHSRGRSGDAVACRS
jgi:hypothetical protein